MLMVITTSTNLDVLDILLMWKRSFGC